MLGIPRAFERDQFRVHRSVEQRALERLQRALQQKLHVLFHGGDSTGSEKFERIHIERPAHLAAFRQGLEERHPAIEQAVQCTAIGRLEQ